MTLSQIMEQAKLNACLPAYKNKKAKALSVCIEQLMTHSYPYCAVSGGKDSVAMACLLNEAAHQCNKSFTLWLHFSDASFPGTLETCQALANKINRKLDIFVSNSAFDSVNKKKCQEFGKSGVFFDSVKDYAKNKDVAFVGVRAYESKRRMNAAKSHGMTFHSKSMGDIDIVNPLQWFRLIDVMSLIYEYNAPIHPIYYKSCTDVEKNSNKEPFFIRLGYITSKDLLDKGTAVFLKLNYPDIYNKLLQRFPELKNHV